MAKRRESANVRLTDVASIPQVVAEMTLAEKAALVGGALPFETAAIEHLGVPAIVMVDGHNGVNIFHLLQNFIPRVAGRLGLTPERMREASSLVHGEGADGVRALVGETLSESLWREHLDDWGEFLAALAAELRTELPAAGLPSCFPTGVVMSATWDPALAAACGAAVAGEARSFGVDVVLGPNVNIQRDPLWGRGFESFSEDPLLSAEVGAAYIRGVQGEGVAAVVKHFVANNQEHERLGVDARITERTLREIYLPSFRKAVCEAGCWMVMSAYNKVNGAACAMNRWLLTDVLRGQWGFGGFVVSDWGAAYDRVEALRSGNDLEMPGPCDPAAITAAVREGDLAEAALDERVRAILGVIVKLPAFRGEPRPPLDREHSTAVARQVAAEGAVLLRNESDALPLAGGPVALFGANAREPIATGTGSAGVACPHITSVAEGLVERFGEANVIFDAWGDSGEKAEAAVVCVGSISGEFVDRESLDLPDEDVALIRRTARRCRATGARCVVVLNICAPVTMDAWIDEVDAVLVAWLGGMEIGRAVAAILAGDVNPSGKLPLTFPRRREETPTFLNFPGEFGEVIYGEGIFVGYRYYDTADVEPLFCFGHGLSYTRFELSDLALDGETLDADAGNTLTASVTVTNTGDRRGKEVAQCYIRQVDGSVRKPAKELKGFAKVDLEPGESAVVRFTLDADALRHYDGQRHAWRVEPGRYRLLVGVSSRDIRAEAAFRVESRTPDE